MSTAVDSATTSRFAEAGKFLTFNLGDESYGVAVLKIREIIRMQKITPVPHMPHYARGVINLRGKVIPVVDMRVKFGLPTAEETERTCIVVVQVDFSADHQSLVGLIVDSVEEVTTINPAQVEENPELGCTVENRYILGIAKVEGGVKTLLEIDKLIAENEFSQL